MSIDMNELCVSDELIEQRKRANLLILKGLENYFKENEQIRFIQGLWDLQLNTDKDLFHEEPMRTLERLNHYMPDFFPLDIEDEKAPPSAVEFHNLLEERNKFKEDLKNLERENLILRNKINEDERDLKNLRVKNENLLLELAGTTKHDKETMEEFVRILISKN